MKLTLNDQRIQFLEWPLEVLYSIKNKCLQPGIQANLVSMANLLHQPM